MADQEQRDRYTRVGQAFLAKAAQRLATIDASVLSPGDLARWIEVALKLEEAGQRGGTYDRAAYLASLDAGIPDEAATGSIVDD